MRAMRSEDAAAVRAAVDAGADPNERDTQGNTPLMHAAQTGNAEVVQALIDAGAALDLRHPEYLTTALIQAIDAEHEEVVQVLRRAGAYDDTVTAENGRAIGPGDPP